jgi:hypothetical protein
MIRTVLIMCVGIVALDAAESLISRGTGAPSGLFTGVQIGVHLGIGGWLRRSGVTLGRTAVAAAIVALAEGTVGLWVIIALGASPNVPLRTILGVLPFIVLLNTAVALAGYALTPTRKPSRS